MTHSATPVRMCAFNREQPTNLNTERPTKMAYKVQFKTPFFQPTEWHDVLDSAIDNDLDDEVKLKIFESKKLAQKQIDFMRYDGDDGNEFKIVEIIELAICKDTSDFGEEWSDTRYNVIDLLDGSFSGRGESFSRLKDAISYCKSHKVGWERRKNLDCED